MPVYNYYRILETDDYRYLCVDFDEENPKFELKTDEKHIEIFNQITLDFADINDSQKLKNELKKKILQKKYSIQIKIILVFIEYYVITEDDEWIEILESIGEKFDKKKPGKEIDRLLTKVKGLKNKVNKIQAQLNKQKENQNEDKTKSDDLFLIALEIEQALELGRPVNPKKTTIIDWVNLLKLANEKAKKIKEIWGK